MLFELISYIIGGERRQKAKALARGRGPRRRRQGRSTCSAALQKFPGIRPDPEAFVESLEPLQPRLYSISSSPKSSPGKVSLTVDAVRYEIGTRARGLASPRHSSPSGIAPGDQAQGLRAEVADFALPADPSDADHHDRTGHRHRAVPRLPARAHGDAGARPQLAVLRPPAPRLRFLL